MNSCRISVQPWWCRALPIQQQSVLFLAGRGPDGIAKSHPCKAIQVAYRACVFVAARYGRPLRAGDQGDSFMSLAVLTDESLWQKAVEDFFAHQDSLPHHYLMHLMHGVQILGFKHPDLELRQRWHAFYLRMVSDRHLSPETKEQMDQRLGDWGQAYWDLV